jgi:hypothetical protein
MSETPDSNRETGGIKSQFSGAEAYRRLGNTETEVEGEEINEETQRWLAQEFMRLGDEAFAHNPRVLTQEPIQDDDEIKYHRSLTLDPDLDPGAFVDALQDTDAVVVNHFYRMDSPSQRASSEVTVTWNEGDTYRQATFVHGEVPLVQEYVADPQKPPKALDMDNDGQVVALDEHTAFKLGAIRQAVITVLGEQESFEATGKGASDRGLYDDSRLGRGSHD